MFRLTCADRGRESGDPERGRRSLGAPGLIPLGLRHHLYFFPERAEAGDPELCVVNHRSGRERACGADLLVLSAVIAAIAVVAAVTVVAATIAAAGAVIVVVHPGRLGASHLSSVAFVTLALTVEPSLSMMTRTPLLND